MVHIFPHSDWIRRCTLYFSFTISGLVHFEVNWVSIPSSMYMWTFSIAVLRETIRASKSQYKKNLFFFSFFKKFISIDSYFNVWLCRTNFSISSVWNNFYDGRIKFQQEGTKHYFPSNKSRNNLWERGNGCLPCQFILECRARLLEKTPEWRFD